MASGRDDLEASWSHVTLSSDVKLTSSSDRSSIPFIKLVLPVS